MPKLKTHKGAKKRFKISGSGKALRMKGLRSHLRRKKHSKVKRQYGKKIEMTGEAGRRVKRLLPYS